jgi:hypothetical protein
MNTYMRITRNSFKLIENTNIISNLDTICKMTGKYSFGGNCGMYALGLYKFLKENNIDSGFLFCQEKNLDLDELIGSDEMLYHVALAIEDNPSTDIYDGDGKKKINDLNTFCKIEYGDSHPYIFFSGLSLSETELTKHKLAIEDCTNWNKQYNQDYWYNKIKSAYQNVN